MNAMKTADATVLTIFLFPLDPSAALLTIGDAEENAFVSAHIKKNDLITRKVWLGLTQSSTGKKQQWLWVLHVVDKDNA